MIPLNWSVKTHDIITLLESSSQWRISYSTFVKMKKLMKRYKDENNLKGRLGEVFVYDNIVDTLNKMGYKRDYSGEPMTYYIKTQYRHKRKGIDIYVRMVNSNNSTYKLMIEVSNWCRMRDINNYIYRKRISDKFKKWDSRWKSYHLLAINKRNVKLLKARCRRDGILILELPEHITPGFLMRLVERGEFNNQGEMETIGG